MAINIKPLLTLQDLCKTVRIVKDAMPNREKRKINRVAERSSIEQCLDSIEVFGNAPYRRQQLLQRRKSGSVVQSPVGSLEQLHQPSQFRSMDILTPSHSTFLKRRKPSSLYT